MFEKPSQNSLEENGTSIETPKSEEVIINPDKIISKSEAPLIREDDKINAAREKISTIFSKEVPEGSENDADKKEREELELKARELFAKMSTENPLRAPTKEVGASYDPDKKFEGLEPITKEIFQIKEIPGATFSEEVYHIRGEVRARVAIINDSGEKIYLDNLLPSDVRLVPVDLLYIPSNETAVPQKIEAYKMKDGDSTGCVYISISGDRQVGYDTLKSKEGISALFHEMGHAWNDEAGLVGTGKEARSFKSQLKNFWDEISGQLFGTVATIQENTRKNRLENKIFEERDAWAHGFRMMRFLKSNGFPLHAAEISGALRKMAEHCLSTYEESRKEEIERFKPRRGFISRRTAAEIVERQRKKKDEEEEELEKLKKEEEELEKLLDEL